MQRAIVIKVGGAIVTVALFVLGVTLPSTPWINENRAVYISIVALVALAIGGALWFVGVKIAKRAANNISPLEDIKADLVTIDKCQREVAVKKTHEQYSAESTKKLRSDFSEYITESVPSLLKGFADTSNKERILDSLISFFVGISDILDSNDYGLKYDLSDCTTYANAMEDIAKKQHRLDKKGRVLTQKNIRKVKLLTYGLNSVILFRQIYRSVPKFQEVVPLQFSMMLEGVERVAEKLLAEMLNNLDVDWQKIIKIDFDEI